MDYWLDLLLKGTEIERVLVNTHYLRSIVEEHIKRSAYSDQIDTVFEKELLGTGGTVLKNEAYFSGKTFFVAHADNLTRFKLDEFIKFHNQREKGVLITMMTFRTDNPSSCGIVELDSKGLVLAFHEKVANPPGNLASAAVYIFEPAVLDYMKSLGKQVFDISLDVIPHFVGRIQSYLNSDYHRDIGTPESLAIANRDF